MNVFRQNIDAIRQKKITQILLVHKIFFWMITLITPEMSIIDYQFNSTSYSFFVFIEKDKKKKIQPISHVTLC